MENLNEKKRFEMPHVYVILMIMMLLVVIVSQFIPSGQYVREIDPETGVEVVDPDSYHEVEKPAITTPLEFGEALYQGAMNSAGLFFQILMVCGALEFLQVTGSFEAGIGKLIDKFKNRIGALPAIILLIFTILGNIGMQDGCLPLYPIAAAVMMRAGYDKVVAAGVGMLGQVIGYSGGALNMFSVGVAQSILGIPIFSGFSFRLIGSTSFYIVVAIYVTWYCNRTKKDPTKSVVADDYIKQLENKQETEEIELSWQRAVALIGLVVCVFFQGYGPLKWDWGIAEMTSLYVLLVFVIALIFKIAPSKSCNIYMEGAKSILPAAFVLAFSNAILVLLKSGLVIDTVINGLVNSFEGKGDIAVMLILYVTILGLEFILSTGTGKAMLLMPILGPVAQMINMSRQLLVIIYQYAEGVAQVFFPTSGTLLAALSVCNVRYQDWIKFAWKPVLAVSITNIILIMVAFKINLGPF